MFYKNYGESVLSLTSNETIPTSSPVNIKNLISLTDIHFNDCFIKTTPEMEAQFPCNAQKGRGHWQLF